MRYVKVSSHTVEKHLLNRSSDASLFFNKDSMMYCIQQCLTDPDKAVRNKLNRWILEKEMSEDIGMTGHAQTNTRKLKVICNSRKCFVITAYPIK